MSYSQINESFLNYFINLKNHNNSNLINILEGELHLLMQSVFSDEYRKILITSNNLTNNLLYKKNLSESEKNEIQLDSFFSEYKNLNTINKLKLSVSDYKINCQNIFNLNFDIVELIDEKNIDFWGKLINNPKLFNYYDVDDIIFNQSQTSNTDHD